MHFGRNHKIELQSGCGSPEVKFGFFHFICDENALLVQKKRSVYGGFMFWSCWCNDDGLGITVFCLGMTVRENRAGAPLHVHVYHKPTAQAAISKDTNSHEDANSYEEVAN